MNKIILLTLALLTNSCFAAIDKTDPIGLAPKPEHLRATELITFFLENYHYKRTNLDDSLSAKILDNYIDALDPNRMYFIKGDIAKFEKFRSSFDDFLKDKKLDVAFDIFGNYRKRLDERINYALSVLKQEQKFDISESYKVDRSKDAWAASKTELDDIWRKRVKNDILNLKLAGKSNTDIVTTLTKRYQSLARHTQQLNADDVFQYFINAYTTVIEPHTAYFSPRTSEDFRIRMSLSLEGVGAVLRNENEYTVVQQVVPGGPAEKSGRIQPEDKIIAIAEGTNGQFVDVVGWRLENVVDLIRGPKGSKVRLQIIPAGAGTDGQHKLVEIVRETIKLEEQAAQKSVIEVPEGGKISRIGVIKLPAFYLDFAARTRGDEDYRSTTRDVGRLLAELSKEHVQGIIMDLRGNGGGSLLEATELTGLFIEKGPIVQIKDSNGHVEVNFDEDAKVAYRGPLAVLVDRQSASASEIFAGAIQDYHRGIILGEPTFGKGTVQNLVELDRYSKDEDHALGQLKATVAQFFRVTGSSTQHRGVDPDIVYPTALYTTNQGERTLENALPWARVEPVSGFTPGILANDAFNEVKRRHEIRVKNEPAFRLVMEEARTIRDLEEKTQVSLLESVRRTERDSAEKMQKERDLQWKAAQGLKVIEQSNKQRKEGEKPALDVLLNESAKIIADLVDITTRSPAFSHAYNLEIKSSPDVVKH